MLRRTLRWLLAKEVPFTPMRSVMAKARPTPNSNHNTISNSNSDSTSSGAALSHPKLNGFAAHTHHDNSIDEEVGSELTATSSTPAATASTLGTQHKPREMHGGASEDAYRFLLHHIDSEIAALKRRVVAVGKQREVVEDTQTRRIRELFNCIERPWLLLESIPAPQLPNKAFDVYAKEQYIRRHGRGGDDGNSSCGSNADFEQDAVFLDACRRNWKSLSIAHRKAYEIAARRNEQTRKELKKRMSNGCSFFESLCEQLKEWTADMVRGDTNGKFPASQRAPTPRNTKATAGNAANTAPTKSERTQLTPLAVGIAKTAARALEPPETKGKPPSGGACGKLKKAAQRIGAAPRGAASRANTHATTRGGAKQKAPQRPKAQRPPPKGNMNRVHRVTKANTTRKAMVAKRRKKK